MNGNEQLSQFNFPHVLKIISLYSKAEHKMNEFIRHTKVFCKNSCPKKPIGCCNYDWHNHGISNRIILRIFKKMRGHIPEKVKKVDSCEWHSAKHGCLLKYYRSPSCIGTCCPDLITWLRQRFQITYHLVYFVSFFSKIVEGEATEYDIRTFKRKVNIMLSKVRRIKFMEI